MTNTVVTHEIIEFAQGLADTSRTLIRQAVCCPVRRDSKSDGSPVTATDRAVENRLRELIEDSYPGHGVVGEEYGESSSDRELIWVLDPIDGTLAFMAGIPVYGTLIALLENRAPVLGIIDMPATGERWIGCHGEATTCNGEPVCARRCEDLSAALLSTSNPDFFSASDLPVLERLKAATAWAVYGGSCMAYAQIASGRIDIGIDVAFEPFDYLALAPVVEGAGGIVSDWAGESLTLDSGDRFIAACSPQLHRQALKVLNGRGTRRI